MLLSRLGRRLSLGPAARAPRAATNALTTVLPLGRFGRHLSSGPATSAAQRMADAAVDAPPKMMPLGEAVERLLSQRTSMYAKLLIHNTPFTVTRTDFITTHRLKDVSVGDLVQLHEVREVGTTDYKLRGPAAVLPRGVATVTATVMEHTCGEKMRAKMRRQRKGHRPLKTIKPYITILRVQDIILDKNVPAQ